MYLDKYIIIYLEYAYKVMKPVYTCDNCGNEKADHIIHNMVELDHLVILKQLVNGDDLNFEQIGTVAFNLFHEEED